MQGNNKEKITRTTNKKSAYILVPTQWYCNSNVGYNRDNWMKNKMLKANGKIKLYKNESGANERDHNISRPSRTKFMMYLYNIYHKY